MITVFHLSFLFIHRVLSPSAQYVVGHEGGAKTKEGNQIHYDYFWQFQT